MQLADGDRLDCRLREDASARVDQAGDTAVRRLDEITANGSSEYWVAELADGVLQRETAMLLRSDAVRSRIHRLILSASDACGAIGGLQVLRDQFGLVPDAISGFCSSSPLGMRELHACTELPTYNNVDRDLGLIAGLVV